MFPVGWREWVRFPELGGEWLKAKIDTGARSSALHAFDLEPFERDGTTWMRFSMHPHHEGGRVEAPLIDTRDVKSSTGIAEARPVIRTRLLLGPVDREVEVTLTRRDQMGFPVLIGRQALRGSFAVEPGKSFLAGMPQHGAAREPFVLGDAAVEAGHRQQVELDVAPLASGRSLGLPVIVVHGLQPGPTVWVNAGIWGDDVGGVEAIRRVLDKVDPGTLRGTLLAVPVVNVQGFATGSRLLPDGRDLAKSFPGSVRGSLGRRLAHRLLTEVVQRCSAGIDLRSGSLGHRHAPQLRADLSDPEAARLAAAFGAPLVWDAGPNDGSLRSAAARSGVVALVCEGGEARRSDAQAIDVASQGVLRVLAALSMTDPVAPPRVGSTHITASRWARASASGLLQLDCELGQGVDKGQVLGRVYDAMGQRLARCRSPTAGRVIGLKLEPLVYRGDALVHVAATTAREPL